MSHISMKKLPDDFSGYQMIAGWDGSKKNIVRYEAGKKPRTVKIITGEAYRARKAISSTQAHEVCDFIWVPDYIWVCQYAPTGDDVEDDELCEQYGHWEEHGGHYEPYCWEEPDPDPDPDPFQDCLNNGGSYDECNCQLYGICDNDPDQCDPTQVDAVIQEFNDYVAMAPVQSGTVNTGETGVSQTPIIGSGVWKAGGGLLGGWEIRMNYDFKYYHHEMWTTDLQRLDEYDLFYFHAGNGYFVGSNSFITTTYTTTDPTTSDVYNNNTSNCFGVAHLRGLITHESNVKIKLPICDIALRKTEALDTYMTLYPK